MTGRGRAGGGMGATVAGAPPAPGPGSGGSGAPSWPLASSRADELGTSAVRCSRSCKRRQTRRHRGRAAPPSSSWICVFLTCPRPAAAVPPSSPVTAASVDTPRRRSLSGDFEVSNLEAVHSSAFSAPALPSVHTQVRPQAEPSRGTGRLPGARAAVEGRARCGRALGCSLRNNHVELPKVTIFKKYFLYSCLKLYSFAN